MSQSKRRGECLFCTSRRCYRRIYTSLSRQGGPVYDEVACVECSGLLAQHADANREGLPVMHSDSTGTLSRAPKGGYPPEVRESIRVHEALQEIERTSTMATVYRLLHDHHRPYGWNLFGSGDNVLGAGVHLAAAGAVMIRLRPGPSRWPEEVMHDVARIVGGTAPAHRRAARAER